MVLQFPKLFEVAKSVDLPLPLQPNLQWRTFLALVMSCGVGAGQAADQMFDEGNAMEQQSVAEEVTNEVSHQTFCVR